MQDADLDRVLRLGGQGRRGAQCQGGTGNQHTTHARLACDRTMVIEHLDILF